MTAKEKSKELYKKYFWKVDPKNKYGSLELKQQARQCAIIAVDEILALGGMVGNDLSDSFYIYYQEVKNELNQL
jgi:predicted ATP-grasp superfamily ATP-dependent carboligase